MCVYVNEFNKCKKCTRNATRRSGPAAHTSNMYKCNKMYMNAIPGLHVHHFGLSHGSLKHSLCVSSLFYGYIHELMHACMYP